LKLVTQRSAAAYILVAAGGLINGELSPLLFAPLAQSHVRRPDGVCAHIIIYLPRANGVA